MLTKHIFFVVIVICAAVAACNLGHSSSNRCTSAIPQLTTGRGSIYDSEAHGALPVTQSVPQFRTARVLLTQVVGKANKNGTGSSGGRKDSVDDVATVPNVEQGNEPDTTGRVGSASANYQAPTSVNANVGPKQGPGHEPGWEWSSGGSSSGH